MKREITEKKEEVKSLLNSILQWLKEGTREAVKEAQELKKQGEKKVKIYKTSQKIKDKMAELGDRVFTLMKNKKRIGSDKEVKKLFEEIKILEKELQRLKKSK